MSKDVEQSVLEKIQAPGWTTPRAVVRTQTGDITQEDIRRVEEVMVAMARAGLVELWRLTLHADKSQMMAAAKPGFDLAKELKDRQAWADAERYPLDD